MAIIKCKMCGGDLNLIEGASTAQCDFCGSVQTIPNLDDEKKLVQFERAERLRKQCEFDKAAGIYETIVADFRQEAEAYWGLVLCKYGIEYVDDPATGKKIPTCHRSSFDSIMEDSDFEQALENADGAARKVYREEAKAIEELRKGIISVSSNEQPYDIFICYKETAENGERTLDSVLAQDVYDALTGKGYRVFFSRITLEDKLGVEYEPYIFAALNSAKIMLAFGTDYEYFNAVWVKNEWSRFLKLMAKDKDKHLIPCFKGIDAYDMPKEFAKLQAQDLGKVGAMQDLLRGIEKILPKHQENTTVIQERIVVGGSGDNKIASLLDRGNMALEDGDWAKADSFFEDVLNNDSKNAQAYLGKTLAMEKCRTIDAFSRKRKEATRAAHQQTLYLKENSTHVDNMASKYALPGYVEEHVIRKLYEYPLGYDSHVAERKQQYREEEKYWAEHKLLSKAEKFATGAVAENLQREKKALFTALNERVKQAEAAEAVAKAEAQSRYEAHLKQADEKAEKLHNAGLARRETHYQQLLSDAKSLTSVSQLIKNAEMLEQLGDYQDSKNLAKHCRNRAAEEQAKLNAEAERKAELARQQAEQAAKRIKKISIIVVSVLVAIIALILVLVYIVIPSSKYHNAVELFKNGKPEEAIHLFESLNGFRDSEEMVAQCEIQILDNIYNEALALKDAGEYEDAIALFQTLDGHRDSNDQIEQCNTSILQEKYNEALSLKSSGRFEEAIALLETILEFKDSQAKILEIQQAISDAEMEVLYQEAEDMLNAGASKSAALAFGKIATYKDAFSRSLMLRDPYFRNTLVAGSYFIAGIKNDGTIVCTGNESLSGYQSLAETVATWEDVIDLQTDGSVVAALRSDGTVYVSKYYEEATKWTNIVQILLGYNELIGLQADGNLVSTGENDYNIKKFTDVFEIHKKGNGLYCLLANGNTHNSYGALGTSKIDNIAWDNVRMADRIRVYDDGTVTKEVTLAKTKYNLSSWKNIVAIADDNSYILGVKSDGSVLKAGDCACNIYGWRNIARIYAITGYTTDNVVALTKNGTVLIATEKPNFMNFDCSHMVDIRVPEN